MHYALPLLATLLTSLTSVTAYSEDNSLYARDAYADLDDFDLDIRDAEPEAEYDYVVEKRGLDGVQVEALAARSPTLSEILVREIEKARREAGLPPTPFDRRRHEGAIFRRACPVGTGCLTNQRNNVCAANGGSSCICDVHSSTCQDGGYDSGVGNRIRPPSRSNSKSSKKGGRR